MLGRPAPPRLGAVVVGPDELVEKALAAEQGVEHDLGVVRLSVVEMQVERAVVGQQSPRLAQPRLEKVPVVAPPVVVAAQVTAQARVARAAEPGLDRRAFMTSEFRFGFGRSSAVGGLFGAILRGCDRLLDRPVLAAARVERRIEVDQGEPAARQRAGDREIVALDDVDLAGDKVGGSGGIGDGGRRHGVGGAGHGTRCSHASVANFEATSASASAYSSGAICPGAAP